MFVGVDAHIDPRAVTNSPKISEKTVRFAGAMWASPPYAKLEDFRDPLERIKKSPDELVGGRVVGLTARAVRDMKCARIG